jgi:hypothetical protein
MVALLVSNSRIPQWDTLYTHRVPPKTQKLNTYHTQVFERSTYKRRRTAPTANAVQAPRASPPHSLPPATHLQNDEAGQLARQAR